MSLSLSIECFYTIRKNHYVKMYIVDIFLLLNYLRNNNLFILPCGLYKTAKFKKSLKIAKNCNIKLNRKTIISPICVYI